MKTNQYHFTHTSYKRINEIGVDINKPVICSGKLSYNQMLYSNKIGCLTVIYNVQALGKIYMPLIRKRQDYALWLVILKREKYVYGFDKILSLYRVRSESISNNKLEMLKWNWKLFREIENFSFLKSLYYVFANIVTKIVNG